MDGWIPRELRNPHDRPSRPTRRTTPHGAPPHGRRARCCRPVPHRQLVVSFHTYNFSGCNSATCWNATIAPLAKKVPVVTGEMGESSCTDGYIDTYMPWADRHGISYLGWTWDSTGPPSNWSCSGGPALITSYSGSPTAYG